jgi:hypothetical protein
MNQTQVKAAAAGFIQALYEDASVRSAWVKCRNNKWAGLGELIQATLGLTQTPTNADIAAMHDYAASKYYCATPADVQQRDSQVEAPYVFNGVHPPPPTEWTEEDLT